MAGYEYRDTDTEREREREKSGDNNNRESRRGLKEAIDQERQTNGRHHHPYPRHHSTLYSAAYPKLEQPLARL